MQVFIPYQFQHRHLGATIRAEFTISNQILFSAKTSGLVKILSKIFAWFLTTWQSKLQASAQLVLLRASNCWRLQNRPSKVDLNHRFVCVQVTVLLIGEKPLQGVTSRPYPHISHKPWKCALKAPNQLGITRERQREQVVATPASAHQASRLIPFLSIGHNLPLNSCFLNFTIYAAEKLWTTCNR